MDRETAARLLAGGTEAEVVEVLATQGSVPREAGTRMLVTATQALGTNAQRIDLVIELKP